MSIKLKSLENNSDNEVTAVIDVQVNLDARGSRGLQQDMTIKRDRFGRWTATICLDDFPEQESPEAAAERLSLWLRKLSIGIKGSKVKKLNLGNIFKRIH